MSAFNITESSINQGFSINPSVRLNRRGRLARSLVVLSLAIVVASVAGGDAGANTSGDRASSAASSSARYITVTVAPGETLWSLASQLAEGENTHALVADILEINSLSSVDVSTGQQIRIPLNS
jgi:LysM repeat protein